MRKLEKAELYTLWGVGAAVLFLAWKLGFFSKDGGGAKLLNGVSSFVGNAVDGISMMLHPMDTWDKLSDVGKMRELSEQQTQANKETMAEYAKKIQDSYGFYEDGKPWTQEDHALAKSLGLSPTGK